MRCGVRIVIVGCGLAGYTLARELRKLDLCVPILMIARDDAVPTPSRCYPMHLPTVARPNRCD